VDECEVLPSTATTSAHEVESADVRRIFLCYFVNQSVRQNKFV